MAHTEARIPVYPARKLYVAIELASNGWKLAVTDGLGRKPRVVNLEPFDGPGLGDQLTRAAKKFGLDADCEVLVCMEAGRDGFSVHRWLHDLGVPSIVIDPASVEVNRHKRRAKTDRLDALKLVANLIRHDAGEAKVWRVCRVPSEEAEDARQPHREREALVAERTRLRNRMKGLLAAQGVRVEIGARFIEKLETLRDPRGKPLPPRLVERLKREHALMSLVESHVREIESEMRARATAEVTKETPSWDRKVWLLAQLQGIGPITATTLVGEFFGWRDFSNRREVGGAAGLTPTPYDTGNSEREQGISKAGNHRVRRIAIELAWSWLRFQPESALSAWFRKKFVEGEKRQKRKGIVALARRLLIELWHLVEHGVVPDGARMKRSAPSALAA